jgi:soluble lytic murein transglycosylase
MRYNAAGNAQAARDVVTAAWTGLTMSGDAAASLRSGYQSLLNEGDLHIQRLDHLLWEGAEDRARAMFPLVPDRYHPLAEARLGLRNRVPGVDDLIAAVPESLADDPGLAFERFHLAHPVGLLGHGGRAAGRTLDLRRGAGAPRRMGRPARRPRPRRHAGRGVRDLLRLRREPLPHRDGDDSDFAELEWLAGYCAFRLGRFETALDHFIAFRDTVFSPISMGRAGYWLGRTHEALGNEADAAEAYALGARYQSSFYGQLAQERGGLPVDPAFLAEEDFGNWRAAGSPPPRSSTPHFFYTKRASATSPNGSSPT